MATVKTISSTAFDAALFQSLVIQFSFLHTNIVAQ
jgi:hypothetical protein